MRILLFLLFFTTYSAWSKPTQINQAITPQPSEKSLNENDNTEKVKPHEGVHHKELQYLRGLWHLKGSDNPYTGKSYRLFSDGQKRKEAYYKDGKKDGLEIWWHNGQKTGEINYKNDKQDGLEIWWHENGQKYRERNWKDGKVISRWKYFEKERDPISQEISKEIMQQQEAARAKIREQMLKARSGRRVTLPPPEVNKGNTDNSQNEVTKQEGIDFDLLEYDIGSDIFYLKDPDIPYTGKSFSLQVNGKKRTEGSYVDGKKDGLWIEWNDDGQKQSEDNYKKGKYNGLRVVWHPNGQKAMEGTWINDEAEGMLVWWHPNGQKKCVENIEKGKRISAAKYWNNKGEPVNSFAEANKQ